MTSMNYFNEIRVQGGHGAEVEAALWALQVPDVTRTEDTKAGDLIRVRVPEGVDSMEHWRALRDLRDAIVANAEGDGMSHGMSPTAQALVEASEARDVAMREAYEAEGTPAEAAADQRYAAAEIAYRDASAAHRAARKAHGDKI